MEEQTEEKRIRLVLVGDQSLFRATLGRFLATQPGLEVVGECGTATEAIEILNGSSVSVVLLDSDFRGDCGGDLISASRRSGYKGHFLLVNELAGAKELAGAIKFGASGIFLKSEPPDRLVQAIGLVASGAIWVDQKAIQLLADQLAGRPQLGDQSSLNVLSEREEKVLLGVLDGLTNRKIGDSLGLSESAVKSVVQQLFTRAGVRTRGQLVRMTLEGSLSARGLAKRG
jgi:DNA-binding NarL/FixJ family response regulator